MEVLRARENLPIDKTPSGHEENLELQTPLFQAHLLVLELSIKRRVLFVVEFRSIWRLWARDVKFVECQLRCVEVVST